jgi:hypothetical protein
MATASIRRPLLGTDHRVERRGPPALGPEACQALLACARAALAVATGRRPPAHLGDVLDRTAGLDEPARAFVTLTEDGRLRSCMGSLEPERSVRDSVVTAAIRAALEDPRFEAVTEDELPSIRIAISALGPDRPLTSLRAFRPGVDGVIIEQGWHRGLLLPEVATEFGWDGQAMLDAVCRKAGLPAGAWAGRGVSLLTFESTRFEGPALEPFESFAPGRVPA